MGRVVVKIQVLLPVFGDQVRYASSLLSPAMELIYLQIVSLIGSHDFRLIKTIHLL
jgi:hypothetical protein